MKKIVDKFLDLYCWILNKFLDAKFMKRLIYCKNKLLWIRIREFKAQILWTLVFTTGVGYYVFFENMQSENSYLYLFGFVLSTICTVCLMIVYQKILSNWFYNKWIMYFYTIVRICFLFLLYNLFLKNHSGYDSDVVSNFLLYSVILIFPFVIFYPLSELLKVVISKIDNDKLKAYHRTCKKLSSFLPIQLPIELSIFLSSIFLPFAGIRFSSMKEIPNQSSYYYVLTFLLIVVYLILIKPRHKKDDIQITFLNLDFIDISCNDIFIYQYSHGSKDCRIFKIDFKKILKRGFIQFSDDSKFSISFLDLICISPKIKKDKETTYVYFCMNNIYGPTTVKLNILLSNKEQNQHFNRYVKLDLIIQFNKIGDEIIMQKYEIRNLHKVFFVFNNSRKMVSDYKRDELIFYTRMYQYNDGLINYEKNIFKDTILDKRKIVLHDGPFGCGKTSLDISLLSNYNFYPVVISPWEDNYDNDILFLIFQQLMKSCSNKLTMPTTSVMFFFITAVFSLTAVTFNVIENLAELFVEYKVISFDIFNVFAFDFVYSGFNFDIFTMINYVVSLIMSVLISSILLPYIIIHVKDSSKVHQNYYIKKISKILRRGNQVLVIEDIDRLEPEVANNVFRIISSINKGCIKSQRIIGLISLNKETFVKVKKDESKADAKKIFEDLENKVIKTEVFDDYKERDSKIKYFTECILVILGDYLWKNMNYSSLPWNRAFIQYVISQVYPKTYCSITSLKIKKDNFRTLHDRLEKLKKYVEGESTINDKDLSDKIKEIR